jgi:hypothetical protein
LPFIDNDGDIIVPKDVRPTIDYNETQLGNRKGAKRQFRYKNLHIREYSGYYTVHVDKVDPRKDPVGHLLIDAPEFLVGIISAISVGWSVLLSISKRTEDDNKEFHLANKISE